MAKKKVSEVNAKLAEQEMKEMEEVSKEIQVILESKGYALQPFMQFSEFGIGPRVKLIKVPKETTNATQQTTDKTESGESEVKDGAA